MSIVVNSLGPAALELDVHGSLNQQDYQKFVPELEQRMKSEHGLGLLVHVVDFKGWTPAALWEDLKFDVKHYNDVSRLAIVGEDEGKEWMATVSKPFTGAEIEYYPETKIDAARAWVKAAPKA